MFFIRLRLIKILILREITKKSKHAPFKMKSACRAMKVAKRFAWGTLLYTGQYFPHCYQLFHVKIFLNWMTVRAPIEPQENNIFDNN